jgi:hypothetical protein
MEKDKEIENLKNAVYYMAVEVAKLKENEWGGSGRNWVDWFLKEFNLEEEEIN